MTPKRIRFKFRANLGYDSPFCVWLLVFSILRSVVWIPTYKLSDHFPPSRNDLIWICRWRVVCTSARFARFARVCNAHNFTIKSMYNTYTLLNDKRSEDDTAGEDIKLCSIVICVVFCSWILLQHPSYHLPPSITITVTFIVLRIDSTWTWRKSNPKSASIPRRSR